MSDSLPIDSVSAPPSAASPTDLHHRTRLGTQYNDACPPVNSRVAGGADETRADPGSSSGGGGGGAAWTPFRRDLVVLGAAFLALFAAYSAIQNLETSLHPRAGMGAVSLAVIYGGIVVFAPLAPAVIRYLRPRGAMLVGMSGYCAYIAANAVDSSWVLLLSAGYLGASASVLWVAQGLYSVMLARGHAAAAGVAEQAAIAEFSGIFWGMFAANQVVGNAVAFLVCRLMALLFPPAPAALATPAAPSPQSLPPTTVTHLVSFRVSRHRLTIACGAQGGSANQQPVAAPAAPRSQPRPIPSPRIQRLLLLVGNAQVNRLICRAYFAVNPAGAGPLSYSSPPPLVPCAWVACRAWDHHDLLHVQPLFNTTDDADAPAAEAAGAAGGQAWGSHGSSGSGSGARGGCSTSALISSIAPYSGAPRTTAVIATDLLSGAVLRCEVRPAPLVGWVGGMRQCAGDGGVRWTHRAARFSHSTPLPFPLLRCLPCFPVSPASPSPLLPRLPCFPASPASPPPLLPRLPCFPASPASPRPRPSPHALRPVPLARCPLTSGPSPSSLAPGPFSPDVRPHPRGAWQVRVDVVQRVAIFHRSLKMGLSSLADLEVLAFNDHGDVFSSVAGLAFRWTLTPLGSPLPAHRRPDASTAPRGEQALEHRLQHVPLEEAALLLAGDEEGRGAARDDLGVERSDVYVVRGVAPGQERVAVQLMDADVTAAAAAGAAGGAAALPSDAITLTVAQAFSLQPPSPVLLLPGARLPFRLLTFTHNALHPVQLPSPSYAWATGNTSVASVHPAQGVLSALAQGATTLTATDVRLVDHHQAASIHVVPPGDVKIFLALLAPLPGGGVGGEGEVCSGAGAAGGGSLPGAVACRAVADPVASGGDTWHLVVGREYALWVQVFSHGWPSRPVLLTEADTLLLRFDHPPLWTVVGDAATASVPAQAPDAVEGGGGGGEERSRVVVVRGGQQGQGEVQAELRYREVKSGGKGREEKVVAAQAICVCDPVLVHLPSPTPAPSASSASTSSASSSSSPPVDPVHVVHLPWLPQLDSAPPPLRQHLLLLASGGCGERAADYVWTSSDSNVIHVALSGWLTVAGPGVAMVRVAAAVDGNNYHQVEVRVSEPRVMQAVGEEEDSALQLNVRVEALVGHSLLLAARLLSSSGEPYTNCTALNPFVRWHLQALLPAIRPSFTLTTPPPLAMPPSSLSSICVWTSLSAIAPGRTQATALLPLPPHTKSADADAPDSAEEKAVGAAEGSSEGVQGEWAVAGYEAMRVVQAGDGWRQGGYGLPSSLAATAAPAVPVRQGDLLGAAAVGADALPSAAAPAAAAVLAIGEGLSVPALLLAPGASMTLALSGGPDRWIPGRQFLEQVHVVGVGGKKGLVVGGEAEEKGGEGRREGEKGGAVEVEQVGGRGGRGYVVRCGGDVASNDSYVSAGILCFLHVLSLLCPPSPMHPCSHTPTNHLRPLQPPIVPPILFLVFPFLPLPSPPNHLQLVTFTRGHQPSSHASPATLPSTSILLHCVLPAAAAILLDDSGASLRCSALPSPVQSPMRPASLLFSSQHPLTDSRFPAAIAASAASCHPPTGECHVTPITLVTHQHVRLVAAALSSSIAPFANASSQWLHATWQLEGCDDMAWWGADEPSSGGVGSGEEWSRWVHTGHNGGQCHVHVDVTALYAKGGWLHVKPEGQGAHRDAFHLRASALLQVVKALRLEPQAVLLVNHPHAHADLTVTGGTSELQFFISDLSVAAILPRDTAAAVQLAARARGDATLTAVDAGLSHPLSANASVSVADVAWVRLHPEGAQPSTPAGAGEWWVQVGATARITVAVGDDRGRLFPASQFEWMGMEAHGMAGVVALHLPCSRAPSAGDDVACSDSLELTGTAVGVTTAFQVSAGIHLSTRRVFSDAVRITVYAPLALHPPSLTLAPGASYMLQATGGPSSPTTTIAFASSNADVSHVDSSSGLITSRAPGTVVIRAMALGSAGQVLSVAESRVEVRVMEAVGLSVGNGQLAVGEEMAVFPTGGHEPSAAPLRRSYSASASISVVPTPPLVLGIPATWLLPIDYTSSPLLPPSLASTTSGGAANAAAARYSYSLLQDQSPLGSGHVSLAAGGRIATGERAALGCIAVADSASGRHDIAACVRSAQGANIHDCSHLTPLSEPASSWPLCVISPFPVHTPSMLPRAHASRPCFSLAGTLEASPWDDPWGPQTCPSHATWRPACSGEWRLACSGSGSGQGVKGGRQSTRAASALRSTSPAPEGLAALADETVFAVQVVLGDHSDHSRASFEDDIVFTHLGTGQRETVHVTFNAAAAPSTLVPLNLLWLAALTALVASAILLLLHLVSPAQPYIPHPQPPPSPLPTPSPQRPGSAFHTPGSSAFSPVSPYSQMGSPSPEYVNYAGRTIHRAPGYTNPMEDPRSMY
ncbi:unnamed protein product [Closterium sp. NIES-53]